MIRPLKTLILGAAITLFWAIPSYATDEARLGEFTVLMDTMISNISEIEQAFNPVLSGSIARTRRLELYTDMHPEIQNINTNVQNTVGDNGERLRELAAIALTGDQTGDNFQSILSELWIRYIVYQCENRGITADEVAAYVRREASTFVANRGNFYHPNFDEGTLTSEEIVKIYFTGFGLVVLLQMEGGEDTAIGIYDESTELRPFYAKQLLFRGADLDVKGLPLLEAVIFDDVVSPPAREGFFSVLAGKMIGPSGQFGEWPEFSDEWKTTIAGWTYDHITINERLLARLDLPLYGVDFENESMGPEALMGLLGGTAEDKIENLLTADTIIEKVAGLEALRWFKIDEYPDEAANLFAVAEPLMGETDFALAMLALNVYEADVFYTGEPYDAVRRNRIRQNMTYLTSLINLAYNQPDIDYVSTTAWLDIFAEGSLKDGLLGITPMVARVINADWAEKQEGAEVYLPEADIKVLTYFISNDPGLFVQTSEAVLGFLNDELSDESATGVNPFRVWVYVDYVSEAKDAGLWLNDGWISSLVRLRSWIEDQQLLIRGDDLKAELDRLVRN
ncbi:MAG TPA: hypothetical protein VGB30_09015 [bacterium]|jgi:hypothetical protein